jgi:hypothetical protein
MNAIEREVQGALGRDEQKDLVRSRSNCIGDPCAEQDMGSLGATAILPPT